jgi:hypothetical protein
LDDEDDRSGDDELNDVPSEDEESGVNNGVGADNDGVGQAEETRVVTDDIHLSCRIQGTKILLSRLDALILLFWLMPSPSRFAALARKFLANKLVSIFV